MQVYKDKMEELGVTTRKFYPLLNSMQDNSSFVVWMRCPWNAETLQQFPYNSTLRPNCVLDFAEDLCSPGNDIPKRQNIPYIAGPDLVYMQFPQFEYIPLSEQPNKLEAKWISMNVPHPVDVLGLEQQILAQKWNAFYKEGFTNVIKEIENQKNVTLIVTSFGSDLWSKVCLSVLP